MEGEALGLAKIICPNTGECQGQKVGVSGLRSRAGVGYRGLWGEHLKYK
jgi:putative component of toxin-antitoxin plasmid stabilization module